MVSYIHRNIMKKILLLAVAIFSLVTFVSAEEYLPQDNGATYHNLPRYRASEEHPLRWAAYAAHPVGWIARELVVRPLNYLVASTRFTRSFFGFREQGDYRQPFCFSGDNAIPDCRSIPPYNYLGNSRAVEATQQQVLFPDVNFDFDVRSLNESGKAKAKDIADLLAKEGALVVVLEGHTDNVGSDAYNNTLGLDRAEAVRKELVALGVAPERLSTVTFGETRPKVNEETPVAHAANRRVEVHQDSGTPQQ